MPEILVQLECIVLCVKDTIMLNTRIVRTIKDPFSGLDKSFSNVVVRWATIGSYLVARPKKWLPRNYFSIIKLNMYVETYDKTNYFTS